MNTIQNAIEETETAQRSVDRMILATPTSEHRNLLTEANMFLLMALEKLTLAKKNIS